MDRGRSAVWPLVEEIVANLGQDLNELARDMFDLSAAKARGFLPKVTGYSKITSEDFGDSEEPPA